MGCKVIFSPQAITDLESAVRYIAQDNPAAAVRVGNALLDRVSILEDFPLIGSPYSKRPGVRKLLSKAHCGKRQQTAPSNKPEARCVDPGPEVG